MVIVDAAAAAVGVVAVADDSVVAVVVTVFCLTVHYHTLQASDCTRYLASISPLYHTFYNPQVRIRNYEYCDDNSPYFEVPYNLIANNLHLEETSAPCKKPGSLKTNS